MDMFTIKQGLQKVESFLANNFFKKCSKVIFSVRAFSHRLIA